MSRLKWLWLPCLILMVTGCTSCGGGQPSANPPVVPTFVRDRAFADLQHQCDFGPRIPGSQAHSDCLEWMATQLAGADRVIRQSFTSTTYFGGPYDFTNVIALFGQGKPGVPLLLCAHWDCRPKADEDPDPANRDKPVPGANDGASGVAVLLEIARALVASPPPRPVILAMLDAEDSGKSGSGLPYLGFCIGAKYLGEHWPVDLAKPAEGVLLDLVGGDNVPNPRLPPRFGGNDVLDFPEEQNSLGFNQPLVAKVWEIANRRGHTAFKQAEGNNVIDDHVPLNELGNIKVIDIIDFPPPEWHTIDDTPEHCSADALNQSGDTLLALIYAGG